MSPCDRLDAYLCRQLVQAEAEAFERHIDSCNDCAEIVQSWERTRQELDAFVAEKRPYINTATARTIVEQAQAETQGSTHSGMLYAGVALLAAMVTLGLYVVFSSAFDETNDRREPLFVSILHPTDIPLSTAKGAGTTLNAGEDKIIASVGDGRLGLSPRTKMVVEQADTQTIRLKLNVGKLAVSLPPRTGRSRLSVQLGRLSVTVTGTIFMVEKNEKGRIGVSVKRGAVRVDDPGTGSWRVSQGETFKTDTDGKWQLVKLSDSDAETVDALLTPKIPVAGSTQEELVENDSAEEDTAVGKEKRPDKTRSALTRMGSRTFPSRSKGLDSDKSKQTTSQSESQTPPGQSKILTLDEIKQLILSQAYGPAEKALRDRLKNSPKESATLELLAIKQHRSGNPQKAVSTYEEIIRYGSPIEKNRARFRAGSILQDRLNNHPKAIRMFQAYLNDPDVRQKNAAEVKLRMAKSYQKMGNMQKYRQILRRIVEEHGGTEAAEKAGGALNLLDNP